jgi:hypothetical protein
VRFLVDEMFPAAVVGSLSEPGHDAMHVFGRGLGARPDVETPTDLEAGFSSTGPAGHHATRAARSAWPFVSMDQSTLDRAVAVQDELAALSRPRAAKIADLLIAAAAEAAGLVVLHYDHDFDVIAQITGQPVEWIVPAGTVS